MPRKIPLTQNKFALVDDQDHLRLSQHIWSFNNGYATRNGARSDGPRWIGMHRVVANAKDGEIVDHINGDTLDNRRCNLRTGKHRHNIYNRPPQEGTSSQYKGVSYYKRDERWVAKITHKGHKYHLGYFDQEDDAAKAYDKKARELFGQFAWLNFPDDEQDQFDREKYRSAVDSSPVISPTRKPRRKKTAKRLTIYCDMCGKKMVRTEHYATRYNHTFCSRTCSSQFRKKG